MINLNDATFIFGDDDDEWDLLAVTWEYVNPTEYLDEYMTVVTMDFDKHGWPRFMQTISLNVTVQRAPPLPKPLLHPVQEQLIELRPGVFISPSQAEELMRQAFEDPRSIEMIRKIWIK